MSSLRIFLRTLACDGTSKVSLCVVAFWIATASLPVFFSQLQNIDVDLPKTRMPPDLSTINPLGWFGYDSVGSSVLLQIINGAGVSVLVGLSTVTGSLAAGVFLGALAGYFRSWPDTVISRIMDVLLAFPPLVLPLMISAFFGGGLLTVVLALCVGGWIGPAKIVRAQFKSLKEREFVSAAKALGASPLRIIVRHLLPNSVAPLIVQSTFTMAGAILAEAGLSFLGIGLGDGHVSWGGLLNDSRPYLIESPHMAIFPVLAMLSLVVSLNFLGEALRLAFDPRQFASSGGQ
jgi:peptide/nickel transport system permease protein